MSQFTVEFPNGVKISGEDSEKLAIFAATLYPVAKQNHIASSVAQNSKMNSLPLIDAVAVATPATSAATHPKLPNPLSDELQVKERFDAAPLEFLINAPKLRDSLSEAIEPRFVMDDGSVLDMKHWNHFAVWVFDRAVRELGIQAVFNTFVNGQRTRKSLFIRNMGQARKVEKNSKPRYNPCCGGTYLLHTQSTGDVCLSTHLLLKQMNMRITAHFKFNTLPRIRSKQPHWGRRGFIVMG